LKKSQFHLLIWVKSAKKYFSEEIKNLKREIIKSHFSENPDNSFRLFYLWINKKAT